MAATTPRTWTADELSRLPHGWRYEIDEGDLLIMPPAGFEHNDVTGNVYMLLRRFVDAQHLGKVLTNELGVLLTQHPQTLRAADVAHFSNERLALITDRRGFPGVAPDMVVEVDDAADPDLTRKIAQYLAAGVRSVWAVDPAAQTLTQHRPETTARVLSSPSARVTDPVLPGFSCRLRALFADT